MAANQATADTLSLNCQQCSIRLSTVALLGSDSDSVAIQIFSEPTPTARGDYLVSPAGNYSQIVVFDPAGSFLNVTGKKGNGPGEFGSIKDIVVRPDNDVVVIADRATLLTPGLQPVRTGLLPIGTARAVALSGGRIIVNTHAVTQPPFLILDDSLRPVLPFGPMLSSDPDERQYHLAQDGLGGVWVASINYRYHLLHFDSGGKLLEEFAPHSDWFPEWTHPDAMGRDPRTSPHLPRISGIWRDSAGLIWIVASVVDQNWKASTSPRRGEGEHYIMPSPVEWNDLFDSILEVFNPQTGRTVAHRRYDGLLGGIAWNGQLWELFEVPSGGLRIRVMRAQLASSL